MENTHCSMDKKMFVSAFSAPSFKFSNGVLTAEASRWLPKPTVTWSHNDGQVLSGITNFEENSAGIFSLVSVLQPVNVSQTYTCRIQNDLVTTVSTATATGNLTLSPHAMFLQKCLIMLDI